MSNTFREYNPYTERGASRNIAGSRSLLDLGLVRHDLHEEGLLVHRERGRALLISGRVLGLEDCTASASDLP
jgi:hypothetical protein